MLEKFIVSSVLIIVMLIIRVVFQKRIDPVLQYSLWLLVALRLLLPGTVGTSPVSVMNTGLWKTGSAIITEENDRQQKEEKEQKFQEYYQRKMEEYAGIEEENADVQNADKSNAIPADTDTVLQENGNMPVENMEANAQEGKAEAFNIKRQPAATFFGRVRESFIMIWLLGMVICALVFLWQNLSLYQYLKSTREKITEIEAGRKKLQVYAAGERLSSPCLFGLIPSVYVPEGKAEGNGENFSFILEHESTHYRHGDHIFGMIRILCLIINWYNPLVWVAAKCSVRDGELACDAGCVKRLGEDRKVAYGEALLSMIDPVREKEALFTYATMMVSEKKFMKKRIANIVHTGKYSVLTALVVILLALFGAGCTFTGAEGTKNTEKTEESRTAETNPGAQATPSVDNESDRESKAVERESRVVVIRDEEMACKIFLSVTDPLMGESYRNVVLIPAELMLPDREGKYRSLEELCLNCTEKELLQILSEDLEIDIDELSMLSYEELMDKIDEAGGITVSIDEREIPYINQYLPVVTGDEELAARIQVRESGDILLHGMQAAAYLQLHHEIAGAVDMMKRWGQVATGMLMTEGISAVEVFPDVFWGLDRSIYVEGEETGELICFEWEKTLLEIHSFLYPDQTYVPSEHAAALYDGSEDLVKDFVEKSREKAEDVWQLYTLYMGESPYMISLLSGEEMAAETEDAWNTATVYLSGKTLKVDEEKGRAVFDVWLVFEENGVIDLPEGGGEEPIQRYLYLKKSSGAWYADGPLHNQLPSEEWWNGQEKEWDYFDFGFSDEKADPVQQG